MDEEQVIRQIRAHMEAHGVTQAQLARQINPDAANAAQSLNQYFSGRRSLFSQSGRAILDALGLEVVIRSKQ
ncbi:helix-turn-helix domain-containing protein [Deinococcus altitudinis]|uniref:helix-turn-helix domain-containing protein n=1 Tax=Deinococcus altitudinis TaxID=468914 RepID=UPI00389247BC